MEAALVVPAAAAAAAAALIGRCKGADRHQALAACSLLPPCPPPPLQAPGAETPASFLPLTLGRLAESLADVVAHYKLREVLGLGAGVGGHVMAQLAAEHPAVS
jgi:pimeloyl-ACP methyl ester carboxylesterase